MTDVQTTTGVEGCSHAEPASAGSGSTRRCVLLGVGAVGATAVLTACGNTSTSTNTNGTGFSNNPDPAGSGAADTEGGGSKSGGGNDSGGGGGNTLAAVSDVPQGGGIIVGDYVVTQPETGTYKAFSKVCTHQGCDVTEIKGGSITCKCHNSKFSIENGEPTSGPAKRPLAESAVTVDGDNIVLA